MILERVTQVVERRRDALIRSQVHYTPERQTERREVHTPGQVVVDTALMEEGLLALSKQIITPLQVVTITHTEEGNRVTDETTVESTPLADFLNAGGQIIVVMASMPVSAEQAAAAQPTFNSKPRFRVYPPSPEVDEFDFYGMEDEGDHGEPDEEVWFQRQTREPDDCGGDCCRFRWN